VALVHGDDQARAALAARFRDTDVILPEDGQTIPIKPQGKTGKGKRARNISTLSGQGIGEGQSIGRSDIEQLWRAVADAHVQPQIVSMRELALAWYGLTAGEQEEAAIRHVLAQEQGFFVSLPDLPDMLRVSPPDRGPAEALPTDSSAPAPGMVLLVQLNPEQVAFALCVDASAQSVRAYPAGAFRRTRFPRSAIREVVGRWIHDLLPDETAARETLKGLVRSTRQWRWRNPPRALVEHMQPDQTYTLDDVADLAAVARDDLIGRMALALLLNETPFLFMVQSASVGAAVRPRYRLAPTWQEALAEGEGEVRPDQTEIRAVLEKHLGDPPDLYKQSVNPDTGEVTLSFYFPAVAQQQHSVAIQAAAEEAGVPVTIAPQPHQGALTEAAHAALPPEVSVIKTSLHHPRQAIALRCSGTANNAALRAAQEAFHARTGWTLELEGVGTNTSKADATPPEARKGKKPTLDMHQANTLVKSTLGPESGCYKVSADQARHILTVRFHFPDVAQKRYADQLAELADQTGWHITVYPQPHQGELEAAARQALPPNVSVIGAPSLYQGEQHVVVRCRGTADEQAIAAAEQAFAETTGWRLVLKIE
jgi:hypothetical protein